MLSRNFDGPFYISYEIAETHDLRQSSFKVNYIYDCSAFTLFIYCNIDNQTYFSLQTVAFIYMYL